MLHASIALISAPFGCFAITLVACLDPQVGTQAALTPLPRCVETVAPLGLVARDVDAAALGRCGHVAVWRETSARALELYAPDHTRLGLAAADNGYSGRVAFAPSGARLAAWSLESDLGFGTAKVYRVDAPLVPVASIRFAGPPTLAFNAAEALTLTAAALSGGSGHLDNEDGTHLEGIVALATTRQHVIYTPDDPSAPTRPLFAFDLDTRTSRSLGALAPTWRDGDAGLWRERVQVTGAGRVVIARECKAADGGACATTLARVLDPVTAEVLVAPAGWVEPRVGAGALVAAKVDDGVGVVGADGVFRTISAAELVAVTATEVLVRREGFIAAVEPASGRVRHLGPAGSQVSASFDDGVAVVSDGLAAHVIGPTGREIHRWEGACIATSDGRATMPSVLGRGPLRRDRFLFVARCAAPNELLVRLDLDSGDERVLAEGHDLAFEADPTGEVVAFSYLPLSGTVRELHAGRIDGSAAD